MPPGAYGEVTLIYAWFAIFNVFLAYGMETAFFRFYNRENKAGEVVSTSLIALGASSIFFVLIGLLFQEPLAAILNIAPEYMYLVVLILGLDALVIIPFAWLRATERPMRYAVIKMANVGINLGLNVFFLVLLPILAKQGAGFVGTIYSPGQEIYYIFLSNLIASAATLLMMGRLYFRSKWVFRRALFKGMLRYGLPVMVAGIAFTINEVFDRVLLSELLPPGIAKSEIGKYAACYKLSLFMTLYATAFRLGIEPFFFSHSKSEAPERAYAQITNYFVVLGSTILLGVVVYADLLKVVIVQNEAYWEAMPVVPIIVLAAFCLGVYHNLSVWYKVTDRTRFGAMISMVGAVVTILINVLFIPSIGYYASAIATLAAYGTMMGLSFYLGRKYYPIPYNFRKILFYGGISIAFSALAFYVFDRNLWIGSALFVVYLGLVWRMEQERLKSIFLKQFR